MRRLLAGTVVLGMLYGVGLAIQSVPGITSEQVRACHARVFDQASATLARLAGGATTWQEATDLGTASHALADPHAVDVACTQALTNIATGMPGSRP
jgi:hypothetical protein